MTDTENTTLELAGQTYTAAKLTHKDWGEFLDWLRSRYLRAAKKHVANLEPEDRLEILWRAIDRAIHIGLDHPYTRAAMSQPDGMAFVLWLSVRKDHRELTPERIIELMGQTEKAEQPDESPASAMTQSSGE